MTDEVPMTKVSLRGPNGEVETLWAVPLGDNRYRLENTPWYAHSVSYQDIVEALPDADGQLQFTGMLQRGGHRTVRIRSSVPFKKDLLEEIAKLGASYESADRCYIGIDIPPDIEFHKITSFLETAEVEWELADPSYAEVYGCEDAT